MKVPHRMPNSLLVPISLLAMLVCTPVGATQVCLNAGNSAAVEFWLENFEANGQDDEIRLRSGTFVAPDNVGFEFQSFEAKDLTISGGWNAGCTSRHGQTDTVLDGDESTRIMRLRNRDGKIFVNHLTFIDGSIVPLGIGSSAGLDVNSDALYGTGATIELNKFFFNISRSPIGGFAAGSGLYASTHAGNLRVRNNLFVGNEGAAAELEVNGTSIAYVSSNTVVLNGATNAETGGLKVTSDGDNPIFISNNILWFNVGDSLRIPNGATLYNNDIDDMSGHPDAASSGNVNVDPQFDGIFSFKLKPHSPLVNAGRNVTPGDPTSTDLAFSTRIQGRAIDIGAYETDVFFADGFE